MATKSFLKTVNLRGEEQAESFLRAAESSKAHQGKNAEHSRRVTDMNREQIRKMFGGKPHG